MVSPQVFPVTAAEVDVEADDGLAALHQDTLGLRLGGLSISIWALQL